MVISSIVNINNVIIWIMLCQVVTSHGKKSDKVKGLEKGRGCFLSQSAHGWFLSCEEKAV